MPNDFNNFACRVCGKIQGDPPWGEDGQCPTYDICDCCGVEFGYEDCTIKAIHAFREKWLETGANWKCVQKKPLSWCLENQMNNIPLKYRQE